MQHNFCVKPTLLCSLWGQNMPIYIDDVLTHWFIMALTNIIYEVEQVDHYN